MKRYSLKLASIMLFAITGIAVGMSERRYNNVDIFIKNNASGYATNYDITVKILWNKEDIWQTKIGDEPESAVITIPYGKTEKLGRLSEITDFFIGGATRVSQYGNSNKNILNEIKKDANTYKESDFLTVTLVVTATTTGYEIKQVPGLTKQIAKSEPSKLITFETHEVLVYLDDVKKGTLGGDYKKKVEEICNTNYTKAEQQGSSNLCTVLNKRFMHGVASVGPIKSPKEAAKRIIDGIYEQLKIYRTKRYVQ